MKKLSLSAFIIGMMMVFTSISNAANVTWLAPVNGNWNDGTKWSGGIAPTVNDTAVITVAGTYTVTLNVNASIAKLVIGNPTGFQTLTMGSQTFTVANSSVINPHGILDAVNGNTINGAGTLTVNGKLSLNFNNTVSCPIVLNDTLHVKHQSNNINGSFTTSSTAVIYMNAANSHSILTFANGFTNNGKIHFTSVTCNYANLVVTSGVLTNAAGATIVSDPNPNCVGYHRIEGRLDNQGTISVNYHLRLYSTAAGSVNTGTITFATGMRFEVYAGVWNYNGGTISGNGELYFQGATGNFNTATMPAVATSFYQSTFGSSTGTSNVKKVTLIFNNTVTAALNNTDTLYITHQSNTVSGNFSNTASSVIYMDASSSHSIVTFSNSFTNNGKIHMKSSTCNYNYLSVTNPAVLTNAASALIVSDPLPNCVGYNRIDGRLNNLGTITANYNLRLYSNAGGSINNGTINVVTGMYFGVYAGVWNYTGGTVNATGNGYLYFESCTANFNVATMPNVQTEFYQSTLASTSLPIISNRVIKLIYNNTVSAAIYNTDTIKIEHQNNTMTGALTTATTSVLLFNAAQSHSILTVTSGFTNNGKILFTSATCNYGYLAVSSGVLINSPSGIIQSDPLPNCTGYHRLDAALNNQGTININYTLRHYTNAGASNNTGNIAFTNGYNLEVYNGTWNWNGGGVGSPGLSKIYFQGATASWNTAVMPAVVTYYYQSTLASSIGAISNAKKIQLAYQNTVSANLNNTDTLEIRHQTNTFSGNYSNTASSVLWLNGAESHSSINFNNSFTNNGKILYNSVTGYYGYLSMSNATQLTNAAAAIIQVDPNPTTTAHHRLDAALINQGTLNINYTFRHYTNPGASTNTGTINFSGGYNLEVYNGTWNWNGGTATSATSKINFSAATASWNTAVMPQIVTYYYQSTLASSLGAISNAKKIQLSYQNTVSANLNNTDTLEIRHQTNTFSGNYTNTAASVLWLNGTESHSSINFNNSFTNNGKILYNSVTGYYGYLSMSNATQLTNAAAAIIQVDPNPTTTAHHRLDAALINQGTLNINYTFRHYTNPGASTNTGTINFSGGYNLEVYNGTWNWNGGTATSATSKINFSAATASWNTAVMPQIVTYYYQSTLASSLGAISNAKKIQLSYQNTVSANLNNTDTLEIRYSSNIFSGNYTNTASSVLWLNGAESHSVITFNNSFTNNGKILYNSVTGYYGYLLMSGSTQLTNAIAATIQIDPNPTTVGYHRMDGNLINNGTVAINYQFNHYSGSFVNNGTLKGGAYLNNQGTLLTNNGTISPGSSPGKLSINANLSNKATSIWNIEVGGLTVATQHDQVDNNYASTKDSIDGTLNISLINGFIPSLGDSVIIETHNQLVGTFASITGQSIPGGLYWNIFYRPNRIVLRAGNPPNLDIVSSTGLNGTISPLGTTSIVYNGTQTYNMIPNTGYHVLDVLVDGISVGAVTNYTFNNVIVNHTISVTFAINTYNIVATTTGSGSISPAGTTTVNYGGNQLYNIAAANCNITDSVVVDGINVGAVSTYPFSNVIANHTIHAYFSSAPHITATGPTTFCTGGSVTLDAGAGYTNYQWSNSASTQTTNITTSGTYTCTITSTGGCTSSASVVVTVNPLPSVSFNNPYSANATHVCATDGGVTLNPFGLPAGGGFSGTGVINNGFGFYSFSPAGAGTGTHTLTYTYTDGNGCTNSATTNVIVDQNATVNAGANIILCNNPLANLSGVIGGSASSATWTSNGTGNFGNANNLVTTYTLSAADMSAGIVTLTLTTDNPSNTCSAVSDNLVITYNPDAVADAGVDVACVTSPVSLTGSISGYPATPQWTTTGTGTFANANLLSTTYTPSVADLTAGHVYLVLTPIDPLGNCTFTADSMDAWFNPNYTVNAGANIALCGVNDTIATLNGSFTNATSVTWTTSGSGVFSNASSVNSTYTLSAADKTNGAVTLFLTTNDPAGPCTAESDLMHVIYKYAIADAGADVCGDTVTNIIGSVNASIHASSNMQILWTTTGTGNFVNANGLNTTYNASNADIASGQTKIYLNLIDGAGECVYESDSTTIWYNPHYSVSAGIDTAFCANSTLNISGNAINTLSTTWTTSGTGTFANANNLATTYTPSNADTTAGFVILTLTSNDPAGPCTSVSDNINVTIYPAPNASAGNNTPICNGTALNLTASGGVSYSWTGPNFFTSNQQNIVIPNSTVAMSGTYNVIVSNIFGCSNPASTIVIVNPCGCIAPTLLESHIDVVCYGGSTGSIDLTPVGGSGGNTFLWSNGAITEDVSGLTAGTYTVTVTATGGCTASTTVTINQPASPLPPINITANSATTFCIGGNVVLDAGAGFVQYAWSNGTTTQTNTITTAAGYTVTATDANGCTAASAAPVVVTVVTSPPATNVVVPPIIGLPAYACNGQVNSISVPAVAGATEYIWDGPAGTSFNGGNNPFTNTIPTANITFGNANGSGYYIGVQAANVCGSTQRKVQWVRGILSVPASVIGNVLACENSSTTYSTGAIVGATSYLWTVTGDANINGAGTSVVTTSLSVTVNFGAAWTGGTLCVAAQTPCYTSPAKCLGITRSVIVLGNVNGTFTACPGNIFTYNVASVAGAASYSWTLPPGATGSSTSNSIAVTFGPTFNGGDICVSATSVCGIASAYKCKTIYSGIPAMPASVSGPSNGMCGQTAIYTCPSLSGVTYNWTSPSGSTINSGQGSNAVSVTFGTFTQGQMCVSAQTSCGASTPRCVTVKGAPNTPATITTTPSSWCANTAGVQFDADVTNLSGSYLLNWNYPSSPIATYVLGGGNSTSLILDWGTGNGTVSVTASNACGNATRNYNAVIGCREAKEELTDGSLQFTVSPNPATDFVNVSFSFEKENDCIIELIDMTGKKVQTKTIKGTKGINTTQLDLSHISKGIYTISINSFEIYQVEKMVVE